MSRWIPVSECPGRSWHIPPMPHPRQRLTREQAEARRRAIDAALDAVEARREPFPNP